LTIFSFTFLLYNTIYVPKKKTIIKNLPNDRTAKLITTARK